MVDLTSTLRRRSLPGLIEPYTSSAEGIRTWILKGTFSIDPGINPGDFSLTNADLEQILEYGLYDYKRFTFSSLESICSSRLKYYNSKAHGWPLIKTYYSGFFAAHALMRALGQGIIRLEQEQAQHLATVGKMIIGSQFNVSRGNYHIQLTTQRGTSPTMHFRYLSGSNGGTHETFWAEFDKFLTGIAQKVSEAHEPDALKIVARIDELQQILRSTGFNAGTWLSAIRNKINYQHSFGVWFPFKNVSTGFSEEALIRLKTNAAIRLDYRGDKNPLKAFTAATFFIDSLNFSLASELVELSSTKQAEFSRDWKRLVREAFDKD